MGGALFFFRPEGWVCPLTLALASTGHLVLDGLWSEPEVLFWPLYGITFTGQPTNLETGLLLQRLLSPFEFLGLAIILLFAFGGSTRKRAQRVRSTTVSSGAVQHGRGSSEE